MDWNWFFSSLAQSVAALVGVFSAFVITKIINNQSEFSKKATRTQEILDMSAKHKDSVSLCAISWFNERRMQEVMEDLSDLLKKEEVIQTPEQYYSQLGVGFYVRYVPRVEVIKKIKETLPKPIVFNSASEDTNEASDSDDEFRGSLDSYGQFPRPIEIMPPRLNIPLRVFEVNQEQRREDNVNREGEKIDSVFIDVRHHVRLVNQQIAAIEGNPESSFLITLSIVCALLLFFVGVVYPLSFLPYAADSRVSFSGFFPILFSIKGLLLTMVSLVFLALMGIFWWVNSSLKYNANEVQKLRDAAEFGYYSKYFQIREDNKAEYNAWLQKANAETEVATSSS